MRIAIGGFMHESNTFAPLLASRERFLEGSLSYGPPLVSIWGEAHHEVGGFIAGATKFGYELVPTAMAWATPSGPVTNEFFEHLVDALITGCRMAEADGVLIALHGAMVTPSFPDADAEILRRLRAALGPKLPIAATLDYHGNLSPQMTESATILVGYQTYPHIDQRARGLLAAELLTRTVKGEIHPVCAIAKPPMLINLLGQNTNRPPMTELMQMAREMEKQPGLLSISIIAGFTYADVPHLGPSVIAVADGDAEKATAAAQAIADAMWKLRAELHVACPTPEAAVRRAIASNRPPVLLIDLGDNIGGGSAGDGTVLLAELVRQQARGFIVALHSPSSVEAAKVIGIGAMLELTVGGAVDHKHGEPVTVRGMVKSLHDGKWLEAEARHGGRRQNDQGHAAVLDIGNGNVLLLNSLRTPPFSLGQLTSVGIDPQQAKIIIVKAAVAYKAAYAPIAGEIIEVDTPGLTAINPAHFTFLNIRRPLYPLEE